MLKQILQKYIDQPVRVTLFNSKARKIRGECRSAVIMLLDSVSIATDVRLVPSNTWGGQGLLGVSIRFCSFEKASENVWHVLVS